MSHAAGTDWSLGIEARCRALLSEGEEAERLYRKAIEHLAGSRLHPDLALPLETAPAECDPRVRGRGERSVEVGPRLVGVTRAQNTPGSDKAWVTTLPDEVVEADREVRRELTESINRETDRLTRLVSNLLDMSRLEAGALRPYLEPVSIVDLVSDVLDRIRRSQRRALSGHISHAFAGYTAGLRADQQVITNLIDNALRCSSPKSSIVVSVEVVEEGLRVTVFNEGSQIPTGDLDRLFDKFYRLSTALGGIRLGLSIVRGIVEAYAGRVWAENVGRRGVALTFVLPSPRARRHVYSAAQTGLSTQSVCVSHRM